MLTIQVSKHTVSYESLGALLPNVAQDTVSRSDTQEKMQCASTAQSLSEGISTSYKCTADDIVFCKEARCLSLKSYSQS